MRIAFLTPEFVTDCQDAGGLGNYLNRFGKVLVEQGHQVEIFVSSKSKPRVLQHEGMYVERVWPYPGRWWMRIVERLLRIIRAENDWDTVFRAWCMSRELSAAMERRHKTRPFDIVQSSDLMSVGLAVRRTRNRLHVVRCSSACDLYNIADGVTGRINMMMEKIERTSIRKADLSYAPSRLVADHYRQHYSIPMEVVRPPRAVEATPLEYPASGLPPRFFIHFGQLCRRKGTIWLGEALQRAFRSEPDLTMVWIGRGSFQEVDRALAGLGRHRANVHVLYPMRKPELYSVLKCAEAAVLPPLVDNLPNAVIESLMLGIPVIGTKGASVDELVEQDKTGELVPLGDVDALAAAILKVWRGQSKAKKGFTWQSAIAMEMEPHWAVERFFALNASRDATNFKPA